MILASLVPEEEVRSKKSLFFPGRRFFWDEGLSFAIEGLRGDTPFSCLWTRVQG